MYVNSHAPTSFEDLRWPDFNRKERRSLFLAFVSMPAPFLTGQKGLRLQTWESSIQEAKCSLKLKARPEAPKGPGVQGGATGHPPIQEAPARPVSGAVAHWLLPKK